MDRQTFTAYLMVGATLTAACRSSERQAASESSVTASAAAAESASELRPGDPAPNVTLELQDGKTVSLRSLVGQWVVVYFYPKDDTRGCTIEAEGIRDHYAEFKSANIRVFGVSLQDAASHQAFIQKYDLPFDLAVDTDGALVRAFQVPFLGELAKRQTFLIGRDGKLKRIWRAVTPAGHATEILAAVSR